MNTTTASTTVFGGTATDKLVHELLVQKRAMARAEDRAAAIEEALIERLGVEGRHETDEAKVAVVQTHTPVIDIDTLQATASRGLFYKLTKRVPDMQVFKAMRALDSVPQDVLDIVGERVSKPSVRVTLQR